MKLGLKEFNTFLQIRSFSVYVLLVFTQFQSKHILGIYSIALYVHIIITSIFQLYLT